MLETVLHLLVVLTVPPLLLGVIGRTKAAFAGRQGAPVLQPWYDLVRLFRKEMVLSTTTTWVFLVGPVLAVVAPLTASLLVPLGGSRAPISFTGDLVLFAYLFALSRFFTAAAALDTGSAFEGMGAAREVSFARADPEPGAGMAWPNPDPARWDVWVREALEADLAQELAGIRARQENYLRRELDRIDDYFANYEQELADRAARSTSGSAKLKTTERLAAAKAEHTRRRADQVARHEIRVHPHFDALLLVAEPAWRCQLQVEMGRQAETLEARLVPRARRWFRVY